MDGNRPLIGMTMRQELETGRFYLSSAYSEAVEASGGAPVHLALIARAEYIESVLERLDGILLPGSASDVDPLRYGREPHQAWNVFRGGTLIQDIAAEFPTAIKHEQGVPRERPSHRVTFESGSLISNLAGGESAHVNSHHHQALETIGAQLRATAWASDGLVEALEETGDQRWALGVQWHPEVGWGKDNFARAIFQAFISAAHLYREEKISRV
ncbi:MAG: gamma-glutamyl-gamma-aminobutyrate hydrolase family protein [Acidobacteria bacterium]|nr:gamma-glutamyl-gamma-aminobutyrate hydrolase family protein [Acidobacteriota bacterium]